MDKYSISQSPDDLKTPITKRGKEGSKVQAAKDAKTISPQLVIGGLVISLILVLAGIALVYQLSKKGDESTESGKSTNIVPSSAAKGVITTASFNDVTGAIGNKNFSALKSQYAKQVRIIIPRSATRKTVGSNDVEGLIGNPLNTAQTPWDWHVTSSQLAAWQQGPYGQYFSGNVIIGISADGTVISIGFDSNGQINSIFIAPVADLIAPPPAAGSGNSGGSSTTPNNTAPTTTAPSGNPDDAD
jgi:hypothetical protein